MAMHQLDRVERGERQRPRDHLVERDAQGIQVAARVNRPVHAAGLFGRHVGQRAGDDLQGQGRRPFARKARGDPEAGQPGPAGPGVDQEVLGLDVLVDDAPFVQLAQGAGHADGEPEEASQLAGSIEQGAKRNRRHVLEDQRRTAFVSRESQRPGGPRWIQLVPEFELVFEAPDLFGSRRLGGQGQDEDRARHRS